jgi:hypothetical protein
MILSLPVNNSSKEEIPYFSEETAGNPRAAICRFYDMYGLAEPHKRLWEMLKLTLSSDEISGWDAVQRSNYIFFFEMLKELINANYILFMKLKEEEQMVNIAGLKPFHSF